MNSDLCLVIDEVQKRKKMTSEKGTESKTELGIQQVFVVKGY
jgi:hypothetical protein